MTSWTSRTELDEPDLYIRFKKNVGFKWFLFHNKEHDVFSRIQINWAFKNDFSEGSGYFGCKTSENRQEKTTTLLKSSYIY
jgi:hypothetical protein